MHLVAAVQSFSMRLFIKGCELLLAQHVVSWATVCAHDGSPDMGIGATGSDAFARCQKESGTIWAWVIRTSIIQE